MLAKADVIWAMRERVQLCQDLHTELAILRESPGVSRIHHILIVHGHTILDEEAAKIFDEVGQRSIDGLFPGFTEDGTEQAALRPIRYKTSVDALDMVRGGATAGLLPEQPLLARLDTPV